MNLVAASAISIGNSPLLTEKSRYAKVMCFDSFHVHRWKEHDRKTGDACKRTKPKATDQGEQNGWGKAITYSG